MSYQYTGNNQFPTALTLPDDSDSPNQTNFSPGWEGNRDAALYLLKRTGATALYNFNAATITTGSYSWTAFVWDGQVNTTGGVSITLYGRWIATQNEGSGAGCRFFTCFDGKTWIASGSTSSTGAVCLANSLTVNANFAVNFCVASKIVYVNVSTGGSASVVSGSGWDATQGCAWDNRTTSKAYFVGATQSGGSFTGAAASLSMTGPTLVNLSGNLPSGWASGTNHVGNFRYATDGTSYVVLMCGVTPGTDTARLLNAGVISAPTDITPSVLTSKIGIGIAFDALTGLWVLCAADTSNSYFYSSSDLIAWTLTRTVGFTSTHAKEFTIINGVWVVIYNSFDAISNTSIIYLSSSDGAYWSRAQVLVNDTIPLFQGGAESMIFGDAITYGVAVSNAMSMS